MGRRSGHTPAQKRDAVLAVLTCANAVAITSAARLLSSPLFILVLPFRGAAGPYCLPLRLGITRVLEARESLVSSR
jgi:hypothetical protein